MYMSRIALNRRRRGAAKLLGNRHAMHAAVMSAFPPETQPTADTGRVLWRVDRDGEEIHLYVVSPEKPCLAHIGEQAGWSTVSSWSTRDYAPLLDSVANGQRYVFRLAANPTHRLTERGVKRIRGHQTVTWQTNWLVSKAERHGFQIALASDGSESSGLEAWDPAPLNLQLSNKDRTEFRRSGTAVYLSTVQFDGELVVADVALFRQALCNGIGRAKGYGCGLLTVLPRSER
jgi:CRISPR system Cascade subunit CasE